MNFGAMPLAFRGWVQRALNPCLAASSGVATTRAFRARGITQTARAQRAQVWGDARNGAKRALLSARGQRALSNLDSIEGLPKRRALGGFSRGRTELASPSLRLPQAPVWRSGGGGAPAGARAAAHPQERGTRGTDVRSPPSSASLARWDRDRRPKPLAGSVSAASRARSRSDARPDNDVAEYPSDRNDPGFAVGAIAFGGKEPLVSRQ